MQKKRKNSSILIFLIQTNRLHEVLDKLQEVTLPSAPAKKRKESETVGKKDKKKDKKKKDGHDKETTPDLPSTAAPALPIITAGIKENYIQKAKQDLQIEASVKVKTKAEENEVPANGDDFDIPTITDIAKEAVDQKRHEKELQQLEELQKKIYIAKQQLRTMCSDESDEEDFAGTVENKTPEALPDTAKPDEQPSKTNRTGIHINPKFLERNEHIVPQKKQITMNNNNNNNNSKTTSVHDRLGQRKDETSDGALTPEDPNTQRRVIKLSAVRRAEREIYVPAFRRAEVEKQKVEQSERQRGRDRERDQRRHLDNSRGRIQIERQSGRPTRIDIRRSRERQRTPVQRRTLSRGNDRSRNRTRSRTRTPPAPPAPLIRRSISARSRSGERRTVTRNRVEISTEETETETIRKRIGSRVFVIPPKPPSEEGDIDMSVNSIIKIKPRAQVPENKQANKMLLLRAVAEAQKSTVAAKRKEMESTSRKYTQRRREPGTECILVEIPNDDGDEIDMNYEDIHIEEEDEYIPEPVTKTSESESDGVVYVPKKKSATKNLPQEEYDPNTIATKENTQFVVTMENSTLTEEDKPKRPVKERIGFRMQIDENEEIKRRRKERFEQLYETVDDRAMSNSPSPSPPPVIKRIFNRHKKSRSNTPQYRNDSPRSPRRSRSPMDRKRSVDRKSDFWGDMKKEELPTLRRHRARTISPINFELTDEETRSRSSHEMHSEIENNHREDDLNEVKSKIKKLEPSRKFDNVPSRKFLFIFLFSAPFFSMKPK